jgi:predicted transcriptional regulator
VISLDELVVKDVMSPDPVCLHREISVPDAVQILVGRSLQGAPVVDEVGDVIGVVSTSDLLTALAPAFRAGRPLDVHALHELKLMHVHDLLERALVTCDHMAPINEVCQLMVRERVHRVVVTHDSRRPLGLISAIDMVRAVACLASRMERSGTSGS